MSVFPLHVGEFVTDVTLHPSMPWHPSPLQVTTYVVAQEGEARTLPAVVSVVAPSAVPVARPHLGPLSTRSAIFPLSSPSIVVGPCSLLPSLSVSRLVFDDISVLRGPARNCVASPMVQIHVAIS